MDEKNKNSLSSKAIEKAANLQSERIKDKTVNKTTSKIDVDSTLLAAKAFFNQNRYDDAINKYKKIVTAAPHNMQAHQALGDLYLKKDKLIQAKESYLKATGLEPTKKSLVKKIKEIELVKSDTIIRREGVYFQGSALCPNMAEGQEESQQKKKQCE